MKNVSTGFGLCFVGLGIAAWPVLDRLMPQANAVGIGTTAVTAVAAAATAQDPPAPTVVWYGVTSATYYGDNYQVLFRAWSDGRTEATMGRMVCSVNGPSWSVYQGNEACRSWTPVGVGSQGLTAAADLNQDGAVDGNDLGQLLAKWGPTPRDPVPPSDCPLNLINP